MLLKMADGLFFKFGLSFIYVLKVWGLKVLQLSRSLDISDISSTSLRFVGSYLSFEMLEKGLYLFFHFDYNPSKPMSCLNDYIRNYTLHILNEQFSGIIHMTLSYCAAVRISGTQNIYFLFY